jgi:N-methylhydantoinase A
LIPFVDVTETSVQNLLGDMVDEGRAALAGEGYDEDAVEFRFAADIRYLGQSSQLMIQMPSKSYGAADLRAAFERTYRETFGYIADGEPLELVNLRLSAIGKTASRLEFATLNLDSRALAAEKGERLVSFGRGALRTPARVLPRAVAQATVVVGPAIIESYDTTIVVPPGCTARPAGAGCLAIEMEEMDV